jgi:pyruvate dehydrogenase E1 component alpha subunit/2-oxoisovalerate dehydrogenase E1 component alpha subunit
MLMGRLWDDKIASLYRGGKIVGGVFLGKGQEALSASIGMALQPGDLFAPLIRDSAGRFAFGESVLDATRTYLGSAFGPMRGRDGNIHRGRPQAGYYAMISHLGAMVATVAGGLMAHRMRGVEATVGATCIGEGGTSTGAFHEGLNMAAVEKLPLVVVVANNQYAYSTPNARQFACRHLVERAKGYGVQGTAIDGTDLTACLEACHSAVERARSGAGPQLIVAELLRLVGHGEHDPGQYVDAALKRSHVGRDCVAVAEQMLIERGWSSHKDIAALREAIEQEVEEAVATSLREPTPDPETETWTAISDPTLREGVPGVF